MNVGAAVSLGATLLWRFMNNELVQKAVTNFTAGTKNKWDDKVWQAVQIVLLNKLPPDLAVVKLSAKLDDIQKEYDSADPEKRWEMKKPEPAWKVDNEGRVETTNEGGGQ